MDEGEGKAHMVGARYLEHLSDRDLAWLTQAGGASVGLEAEDGPVLRTRPEMIEPLLGHPEVRGRLFDQGGSDPFIGVSPFLVFAVLVYHCAAELEGVSFVREWVGPRRRLPVFDAAGLVDFLSDAKHRLFLAELMNSYTHVASGAMWVRSARGWRRHRFSELDLVRLASLLEVVPEEDRPGVYRRLGDLALFLTGLFPDHSASWAASPFHAARLNRAVGAGETSLDEGDGAASMDWLEDLGRRCYLTACRSVPSPAVGMSVVASVAASFGQARRTLNFMAEGHLFALRNRWFPGPAG